MYAIVDTGTDLEVVKLLVQELRNPLSNGTIKRSYELLGIEGAEQKSKTSSVTAKGVNSPARIARDALLSFRVADLFALVKKSDTEFHPKSVSTELLDTKGKPKQLYHRTNQSFTAFRPDYRGAIWMTDHPAVAGGFAGNSDNSRVMQVYAAQKTRW